MNILLCTDGSELSEKATKKTAEILSLVKNAEVTVIYVHQPIYTPLPYSAGAGYVPVAIPAQLNEEVKAEGKEILAKAGKTLQEFSTKYKTFLLEGHPASTIIDYDANHDFDLLVIGSKGRTGLEKLLMGSVSSAVVQEVKCDVLVVK